MAILLAMSDIIETIEAYCKEAGISPSTLCVRATGNGRLFDRLKRRVEQDREYASRIEAYMAENPARKAAS